MLNRFLISPHKRPCGRRSSCTQSRQAGSWFVQMGGLEALEFVPGALDGVVTQADCPFLRKREFRKSGIVFLNQGGGYDGPNHEEANT